jgi:hypothetical protein
MYALVAELVDIGFLDLQRLMEYTLSPKGKEVIDENKENRCYPSVREGGEW